MRWNIDDDKPPPPKTGWQRWLERARGQVALSDYYLAFVLLNLGDLFMTGLYIRLGGHEANRLARWIWETFGARGFAIYKFALVGVVVAICEILYSRRPALARAVIVGGCVVFALVILIQVRGLVLVGME